MNPIITAFKNSPDRGRGLARDMCVRWAFEEVGQVYDVNLVTFQELKEASYRELQPFGQIPAYHDGELLLFESGAIVFHIAEKGTGLLPKAFDVRSRAIAWMFCALNTIEKPIVIREESIFMDRNKSWHKERMPFLDEAVVVRLKELSSRLGNNDWLDGDFSAGDLLMVTVLRRLTGSGLLEQFPNLVSYILRAESRSAFKRAFLAQEAVFKNTVLKKS